MKYSFQLHTFTGFKIFYVKKQIPLETDIIYTISDCSI